MTNAEGPAGVERLRSWATYASVAVALTLIVAKLGAYLSTGSVSLLSSLIDSSTDLLASVVTLIGVRHALRPPDRSHRFGHGKAEPLAALAQAAFVTGSALFLSYEAAYRLTDPRPVADETIGIVVMAGAIVVTAALVGFQAHVVRRTGSLAVGADSLHYRGDLLMNLAVIGALLLTQQTGWAYFDPLFGIGIALYLMAGAWRIARGSLDVLMDRELGPDERREVRRIVMGHAAAQGMHDLRTRHTGTHAFIELHLELDPDLTVAEAHHVTDEIEELIRAAFPGAEVMVHQEPFGLDDERLDARIARGRKTAG
ncbi:cation diffusion facilitator family transporter [Arenibaculum pallidiluteum]|uniref:cation diffusion facilitator family transporter n=1 Tax=Arenibaculum pallidiluteum TaxID=2812559 RepID=UPI001A9732CE|nr:cation diffusion facilitator family transporter [Arenibaculum pallidiluteum]